MSTASPPGRPRPRAFTLVELLVVIGIIALLIAILMPALQNARKQARTVQCMAQLRQVGSALANYASAHKGHYPGWSSWHVYGGDGTGDDEPGPGWTEKLAPYLANPNSPVYNCPDFPEEYRINYFLSVRWVAIVARDKNDARLRNLVASKVKNSSQFVLGGDCTQPRLYPASFGTAPETTDDCDKDDATQEGLLFFGASGGLNVHRNGNNVLFADYHVATFRRFDPTAMTYHPWKMQAWADVTPD